MLATAPFFAKSLSPAFRHDNIQAPEDRIVWSRRWAQADDDHTSKLGSIASEPAADAGISRDISLPTVDIAPAMGAKRSILAGEGFAAEIVQLTSQDRIDLHFRAPVHLLVIHEQGARKDGVTQLEGVSASTLHNLTRKLTFVPAGHDYHEWHEPQMPARLMFFYFTPATIEIGSDFPQADALAPRLLFEDKALWDTALKAKALVEAQAPEDQPYFDALCAVLVQELVRLGHRERERKPQARGGLAAWQQRIITAYIEDHLAERIPLSVLAGLARLSPNHFCRAFKQSFGLPPHQYHRVRRMESAKVMLANSAYSVTAVGLKLGFSETSAFSTAFRKATGLTPTGYLRGLA